MAMMHRLFSSQKATDTFPSGLKLLHEERDNIADIVFVHGLTGDRERTWTDPGTQISWPQSLLPISDINARVLTFGYDAYIVSWRDAVSQNCIANHAMNLLTALATFREDDNTAGRSVIFVTHSLGGLVCQDALVQSTQRPERHLRDIIESTRGIIFLGTPHHGSSLAPWGEFLAKSIGIVKQANDRIVQVLRTDSEVLARIQDSFHTMIRVRNQSGSKPLHITCFYEELPVRGVGFVVPPNSAVLPGYTSIGIHGNHMDMTKFVSANDTGFIAIAGELRRWVKELGLSTNPDSPNEAHKCQALSGSLASNANSDFGPLKSSILPWLSKAMVLEAHQQLQTDRCKPTCQWFLQSDEVMAWKHATDSSLLWVHGKPGCGKSTLISALIDENCAKEDLAKHCAFFYCKLGDEQYSSSAAIFRALLRQLSLSGSNKSLHPAIVDAYVSKGGRGLEPASLTASEAAHLLCEVSKDYAMTKIIIDGLDECQMQERERVVQELRQLLQRRPQGLKIVVSSRDSDDVVRSFRHDREIAVDKEANSADLAYYIQTVVEESQLLRGQILPDLKAEVIQSLERDADGMFLWAKLQIKALKEAKSERILRAMLTEFPAGLLELFQRLEAHVRSQEKFAAQMALRALNWSAWAVRPLTPHEFRHALWFGNKDSRFDFSDLTLDLILDVCQNFLIYDQNLGQIRYIHSSAQQYIRSRNEAESVHRMIAVACLSYLTMTSFETLAQEQAQARMSPQSPPDGEDDLEAAIDLMRHNYQAMKPLLATCPFLHYAGSHWCFHAERGRPQSWMEEHTWIWASESAKFTQWLDLHDYCKGKILNAIDDELLLLPEQVDPNTLNLVQISGMLGYENLLWFGLQKRSQDISTTFIWAAYFNRIGIIEKMLSDPTFLGMIPHLEALLHISWTSHVNTISLILDNFELTSGPNRACIGSLVVLAGSFVSGNSNIAKATILRLRRLCPSGEPLIQNNIFECAIISARRGCVATKLDTEILKSINSVRKDILGEDQHHWWTSFTMASATGSKAIMETIISLGSIDDEPEQLELALIIASLLGHIDILPIMLQQQDQLPIGGAFVVALWNAVLSPNEQHASIVRLLLNALDPVSPLSTPKMRSNYPLGLAAQMGHLPSLQNLLERGASFSVTDDWGRTALHYAAENGHLDIVWELLSKMTREEVCFEDKEGLSAEGLATRAGKLAVSNVLCKYRIGLYSGSLFA